MSFFLWLIMAWIPAVIAEYRGHRYAGMVGTAGFIALWIHWIAWAAVVVFALLGPTRENA